MVESVDAEDNEEGDGLVPSAMASWVCNATCIVEFPAFSIVSLIMGSILLVVEACWNQSSVWYCVRQGIILAQSEAVQESGSTSTTVPFALCAIVPLLP